MITAKEAKENLDRFNKKNDEHYLKIQEGILPILLQRIDIESKAGRGAIAVSGFERPNEKNKKELIRLGFIVEESENMFFKDTKRETYITWRYYK